jgi:hypothetical protein
MPLASSVTFHDYCNSYKHSTLCDITAELSMSDASPEAASGGGAKPTKRQENTPFSPSYIVKDPGGFLVSSVQVPAGTLAKHATSVRLPTLLYQCTNLKIMRPDFALNVWGAVRYLVPGLYDAVFQDGSTAWCGIINDVLLTIQEYSLSVDPEHEHSKTLVRVLAVAEKPSSAVFLAGYQVPKEKLNLIRYKFGRPITTRKPRAPSPTVLSEEPDVKVKEELSKKAPKADVFTRTMLDGGGSMTIRTIGPSQTTQYDRCTFMLVQNRTHLRRNAEIIDNDKITPDFMTKISLGASHLERAYAFDSISAPTVDIKPLPPARVTDVAALDANLIGLLQKRSFPICICVQSGKVAAYTDDDIARPIRKTNSRRKRRSGIEDDISEEEDSRFSDGSDST